jgi:hypothetical protein
MADTTIGGLGTKAAPLDYKVPKSIELFPRTIKATFDGSGAGAPFLPAVQIIADSGDVVGTYPVDTAVAAGGSADVSWFPRSVKAAAAASASSVIGACVALVTGFTTAAGPSVSTIPWDTLVYDTSGGTMWSAGDPTKLVAPSGAIYVMTLQIAYSTQNGVAYFTRIRTNATPAQMETDPGDVRGFDAPADTMTHVVKMAATNWSVGELRLNGGAAVQIFGGVGPSYLTFMTMTRLG